MIFTLAYIYYKNKYWYMHKSENYTTKKISKISQAADVKVSELFPYIA